MAQLQHRRFGAEGKAAFAKAAQKSFCLAKIHSSKTIFTHNTCIGYLKQHRQLSSQLDAMLGVATLW
jgi:hypothetical protein